MHYTYTTPDNTVLRQGDILKRTDSLIKLLEQYHPHYSRSEYRYFQVLTQSCDLVLGRRGKHCKARYITIAAVRDISVVISRHIEEIAEEVIEFNGERYIADSHRYNIESFIAKIIDNNEPNYFYLNSAPDFGINDNLCTFLRLSVSLRADEHYQLCTEAKILELTQQFQAKLGWLVGNLYSRVGTDDFAPTTGMSKDDYKQYISGILTNYIGLVPKNNFSDFKKCTKNSSNFEEIQEKIENKINQKKDSKIGSLIGTINSVIELNDNDKQKLRNALSQDGLVRKLID